MRKNIVFLLVLMTATTAVFAGPEEVDVYTWLYNASQSNSGQLDILMQMEQARLTGAGEFYARALRRLLSEYRNITNVTEKLAADDQAMILSALLGAEKYTQAAPDLWLTVELFAAPLVKAEALMALGKIRATTYFPQVRRVLEVLNGAPTSDPLNGERIAFGAIIALEKFGEPNGYLPVYFASTGWYSDRIRQQAKRSLPFIAKDPAPYMLEIVKESTYDYTAKYNALEHIEGTDAPNADKANVAVAALAEGWRSNSSDPQLRTTLASIRKLAMDMLAKYRTTDESIYPLLERSYSRGIDQDEKFKAIKALASQRTDEGARILSGFLMELNAKRQSGNIRQEDEVMVREVIPALGHAGRPIGRPSLNAVINLDWVPAVKTLAQSALNQIGN